MITSPQNPKIKWIRQLQESSRHRKEENAFVVEGVRLVEEASSSGWPARLVLYTPELSERGLALISQFRERNVEVEEVAPAVLRQASDTQSPQGLLAVMQLQPIPLPEIPHFLFVPDSVRDPGNLGTMLRTAQAAGVQAVLVPPGTVDPFSPKVLRSAMGAHFRLPICDMEWEGIAAFARQYSLAVILAAVGEGTLYTRADLARPLILVVGGEAEGAGTAARQFSGEMVHIPMPGMGESLNAAVAAAILFFETVRQRS